MNPNRDHQVPGDPTVAELRRRLDRSTPPMSVDLESVMSAGRMRRRWRTASRWGAGLVASGAVLAVTLQLAGPSGPAPHELAGPDDAPSPTASPVPDLFPPPGTVLKTTPMTFDAYHCRGREISPSVLDAAVPATDLSPAHLAALESMDLSVPPELESWAVLEETDSTIALFRPAPPVDGVTYPQYEIYEIGLVPPGGGALPRNDTSGPIWSLVQWTSCDVQAELDGLRNVDLSLDPARPPDPTAAQAHLTVVEFDCTGGADPTDRIELVDVRYTDTTVEILIGTRPPSSQDGSFTCVGNTPVPFTVDLDEPIGERTLVDASLYPKQPIPPAAAPLGP